MEENTTIKRRLRLLPCLSGLKDEELLIISKHAEIKNFSKNDILFSESDPVQLFFVVEKGLIKLYKTSSEGRELQVSLIKGGDHFCLPLPDLGGKYLVSAMAMEDTTLIAVPAEKFKELLNSAVSETGLRIISGLCERIKTLSDLLEDIAFKDVEQRIIKTLVRLTEEKSPKDNIVYLTTTHYNIASMTGTVREVVSRTMSKLKREGVVSNSSSKGFKINRTKLQDLYHNLS